ncbi:MFS transporter [Lactobacillus iners]|uniref:MFS transporter n=1 Tax=Lactobacillus iners TaxID=147802 RepID=UPI0036F49C32
MIFIDYILLESRLFIVTNQRSIYAWWIFIVSCLISLIGFGLIVNTVGLFFIPLCKELHVNKSSISLMVTLQNLASAITLLIAGKIMSKVNLKWLLTILFAIIGIGFLSLSIANNLGWFYIVYIIIGICQPGAFILSIPVLLQKWFNAKLGTVMGIALGLSGIGGTIFNPLVADVIKSFGWRGGFIFEALLILLILVPASLTIIPQPNDKHHAYGEPSKVDHVKPGNESGLTFKQARKTIVFYSLAIAMFLLQFVSGSVQHVSGSILHIGFSIQTAGLVVSGIMFGAALGKISIGFLLDYFNAKVVLLFFALFGISGWYGQIVLKNGLSLILSAFILGLGQGICLVALPYLIKKEFGVKDYSNILSIINMVGALALSFAVLIDALLFDTTNSYNIGWYLNILAFLISFILLALTLKNYPNKK